jgi:hypothetical protein
MQIADFEAEGAPLADGGDPGEVVPILGSGSALEAAHVDRHLGHLTTKLEFFLLMPNNNLRLIINIRSYENILYSTFN